MAGDCDRAISVPPSDEQSQAEFGFHNQIRGGVLLFPIVFACEHPPLLKGDEMNKDWAIGIRGLLGLGLVALTGVTRYLHPDSGWMVFTILLLIGFWGTLLFINGED